LGGDALYGEQPLVPLRELIQNAGDALRLRKSLQPDVSSLSAPAPIIVEVGDMDGKPYLQVSDTGVGMDAEIIQRQLLNFGQSGWRDDPMLRDYASIISKVPDVSGKFGIGFFSVFMLGQEVEILTRRFDRGFQDTLFLRFGNGLASRPILSPAPKERWLMGGGTTVRVWLDKPAALLGHRGINGDNENLRSVCCAMFPAFDFPILVRWDNEEALIDGTAWSSEPPHQLISRINGGAGVPDSISAYAENLRPLYYANGSIAGRMALFPRNIVRSPRRIFESGSVVVNGAASTGMWGFLGVIEGHPLRAARDVALPNIGANEWRPWFAEQTALIKNMNIDPELENEIAEIICVFGADPIPLVLCKTAEGWLSSDALCQYISSREKISLVSLTSLSLKERKGAIELASDIVFVASGLPSIFQDRRNSYSPQEMWDYFENDERGIEEMIIGMISKCWNIEHEFLLKYARETIDGAYGKYDVEIPIGHREDEEILDFAHVYTRNLSYEDLPRIAERAVKDRTRSGDYQEYFGSGSWRAVRSKARPVLG
jgi:hypothetical protein